MIHDKQLGIVPSPFDPSMSFHNHIGKTQRTESSSTITTTTTDSSSKQKKLSETDKVKITQIFDDLKSDKCWKLSSETTVEKRMKEFALGCKYEQ